MNSKINKHQTAVAILNWNGLEHLKKYLPSVVEHSIEAAHVVVIDNGSTDQSIAWCQEAFPNVEIIALNENLGFAGGYNAGLKKIHAENYVLLNSDVRVTSNWIAPVLNAMEKETFSACQPIIRNDSDPELLEYAGAAGGFIDKDGYTFCAGRIFEVFESDTGQYASNREVFWASGAALFIRAQAFHEVGGLDDDFFAHMEEIDLCWRLKNRGHRIGVCGESKVFHLGGGTLQKISPFKSYLNFRNNLFLLVKNHHRAALYPMILRRMILDGIAALKFLSEGSKPLFGAVLKAHRDFKEALPAMRQKRKLEMEACQASKIAPGRHSHNYTGWYQRSILIDYFLLRKHTFHHLNHKRFE